MGPVPMVMLYNTHESISYLGQYYRKQFAAAKSSLGIVAILLLRMLYSIDVTGSLFFIWCSESHSSNLGHSPFCVGNQQFLREKECNIILESKNGNGLEYNNSRQMIPTSYDICKSQVYTWFLI